MDRFFDSFTCLNEVKKVAREWIFMNDTVIPFHSWFPRTLFSFFLSFFLSFFFLFLFQCIPIRECTIYCNTLLRTRCIHFHFIFRADASFSLIFIQCIRQSWNYPTVIKQLILIIINIFLFLHKFFFRSNKKGIDGLLFSESTFLFLKI